MTKITHSFPFIMFMISFVVLQICRASTGSDYHDSMDSDPSDILKCDEVLDDEGEEVPFEMGALIETDPHYYLFSGVYLHHQQGGMLKIFSDLSAESASLIANEFMAVERVTGKAGVLQASLTRRGQDDLWMIMEEAYLRIVDGIFENGEFVTEQTLLVIARDVLTALCSIHSENMIHRDVRIGNLVIKPVPHGHCQVKLRLSGVVHVGSQEIGGEIRDTRQATITPFSGPEECGDEDHFEGVTRKVDVWGLGVTLYALATGKLPFMHDDDSMLRRLIGEFEADFAILHYRQYSPLFISFLQQLLQKDPRKRPEAYELLSHPWLIQRPDADDDSASRQWLMAKVQSTPQAQSLEMFDEAVRRMEAVSDQIPEVYELVETLMAESENQDSIVIPSDSFHDIIPLDQCHFTHYIGGGAYGKVFLADHGDQSNKVAVKVIKKDRQNVESMKRIKMKESSINNIVAELIALKRLQNGQNVNCLLGFVSCDHHVVFAVRFEQHGTLYDFQEAMAMSKVPFTTNIIASLVKDMASGLAFIHANNIIHRDLQDQNVFLCGEGRAVIGDFGLCSVAPRGLYGAAMADPRVICGCTDFFAPEQFTAPFVSRKVDLFALGVIAFRLVVGDHPFPEMATPDAFPLSLQVIDSTPFAGLVKALLQQNPTMRPESRFIDEYLAREGVSEAAMEEGRGEICAACRQLAKRPGSLEGEHEDFLDRPVSRRFRKHFDDHFEESLDAASLNGVNFVIIN